MATEYGKRLKAARKQLGLTQKELAKKTGIPLSTIATAETQGTGSSFTATFAQALSVDAHWLSTGRGSMTPELEHLTRHGQLREHLNHRLGIPEDDDQDAVWLSEKINRPFEFCESLLCGTEEFTAALAREIELKLGLDAGSLDEFEKYQDEPDGIGRLEAKDAAKSAGIDITNNPEYPAIRRVTFKLSAGASGFGIDYEGEDRAPIVFGKYWYETRGLNPSKLFAVRVANGSMEPGMRNGDTVVVNTASTEPKDGVCFAVNYEGELVIKRLVRDEGAWWLSSDNQDQRRYPRKRMTEDCFVIGQIVHKQSEHI